MGKYRAIYPIILINYLQLKRHNKCGAVLKTLCPRIQIDPKDIVTVAVMPCSQKKFGVIAE
jgi:hypothetical protein